MVESHLPLHVCSKPLQGHSLAVVGIQEPDDKAAWLFACTLQLWIPVEGSLELATSTSDAVAPQLGAMAPVYAMARAAAATITVSYSPDTASLQLAKLLAATTAALDSGLMCASTPSTMSFNLKTVSAPHSYRMCFYKSIVAGLAKPA